MTNTGTLKTQTKDKTKTLKVMVCLGKKKKFTKIQQNYLYSCIKEITDKIIRIIAVTFKFIHDTVFQNTLR